MLRTLCLIAACFSAEALVLGRAPRVLVLEQARAVAPRARRGGAGSVLF